MPGFPQRGWSSPWDLLRHLARDHPEPKPWLCSRLLAQSPEQPVAPHSICQGAMELRERELLAQLFSPSNLALQNSALL